MKFEVQGNQFIKDGKPIKIKDLRVHFSKRFLFGRRALKYTLIIEYLSKGNNNTQVATL